MPGAFSSQAWAGEAATKKRDAENNAVAVALKAILSDPILKAVASAPSKPKAAFTGQGIAPVKTLNHQGQIASKTPLSIVLEGNILTTVEITQNTTLASVRVMLNALSLDTLPKTYTFGSTDNAVQVLREQECEVHAKNFNPQLMVIPELEDLKGSAKRRQSDAPSGLPIKRTGVFGAGLTPSPRRDSEKKEKDRRSRSRPKKRSRSREKPRDRSREQDRERRRSRSRDRRERRSRSRGRRDRDRRSRSGRRR